MRFFLVFCLIWLMLYISACSSSANKAAPGPRLIELKVEPDKETFNSDQGEPVPVISAKELLDGYRSVLNTVDKAALKRDIRLRLADLELKESEDLLVEGIPEPEPFVEAIQMYRSLLSDVNEREEKARLQYQLSKAYSLAGRNEEANSVLANLAKEQRTDFSSENSLDTQREDPLIVESYFRLAESAFNRGDYRVARKQYRKVINQGTSDFQKSAHYMLGWSEFKLNRYEEALRSFVQVLDPLLNPLLETGVATTSADEVLSKLSKSEKNLVTDSLRAMSIAFSYLGGAESIEALFKLEGQRSYSSLFYRTLGELYRTQERYRDAADTYLAYVKYQPFSPIAPQFSELAIQTYYEGNFPSLILPAKKEFVAAYGSNSLFWLAQDSSDLEMVKPFLHEYLQELSSHYHSTAQIVVEPDNEKQKNQSQNEHLLLAADYYGQFVTTFPEDVKTPEMAFLQAEALFEAADYIKAADAYEFVAYQISESSYGNEAAYDPFQTKAAYNLILTIDQVLLTYDFEGQGQIDWQQQKLDASVRFANRYPEDERVPIVLSQVMDIQFKNKKYAEAVKIADQLLNWQPQQWTQLEQGTELVQHATLVAAEAEFIQEHYFAAEMRYRQFVENGSVEDDRVADAQIQIMASLYRQAEALLLNAGDRELAVDRFLAAADFLPEATLNSSKNNEALEIAAVARFDAADNLMDMEDWSLSIEQFVVFLDRHPKHKLAQSIPAKLAFLYQETEQWQLAADNLLIMTEIQSHTDLSQGQTLYLAAQLYQRSELVHQAKEIYKRYVAEYPESGVLVMEAQYQLALMTQDTERDQWIEKLTQKPTEKSERALYLNAWATNEQADQIFQRYNSKQIYLPLKRSLKIKQQALEETINAYKEVLDFGVAEFTTLANYRMAEVYAGLSQSVIKSERPDNLDILALEQYEVLLEEQAFPFEEKAIALHETNAQRSWEGEYDFWVQQSFESLGALLPGRYNKVETYVEVSHGIH